MGLLLDHWILQGGSHQRPRSLCDTDLAPDVAPLIRLGRQPFAAAASSPIFLVSWTPVAMNRARMTVRP